MNRRMYVYLALCFLLFFAGDVVTTWHTLQSGSTEGNVFVAYLLSDYGFIGLIMAKLIVFFLLSFVVHIQDRKNTVLDREMLGICIGAYIGIGLAVCINNMRYII